MGHIHSVYDTEPHFKIDPTTRNITTENTSKSCVVQYDHNSERMTFEIPRFVDGHDMATCNVVEVHYLNVEAATKAENGGMYQVEDLQISPDSEDVVICSWLISQNATRYAGPLNFLLRFCCITDKVDYAWNTNPYVGFSVSNGICNSEIIAEEYADILEQWRIDIINTHIPEAVEAALNKAKESGEFDGATIIGITSDGIVDVGDGELNAIIHVHMSDDTEFHFGVPVDKTVACITTVENNGFLVTYTDGTTETADLPSSTGGSTVLEESQLHAEYGEELATTSGWTTDGWTGSLAEGFTHTAGNTNSLTFQLPENSAGKVYQVSFTPSVALTASPNANLMVRVGGSELFDLYGQVLPINVGIKSVNGGALEFVPASNFTGKITGISVKEVVGDIEGSYTIYDNTGNETYAVRATKAASDPESAFNYNGEDNLFMGTASGRLNTSGYGNVGFGSRTLRNNTSGFWNVGVGNRVLENNSVGSRNIGIGYGALQENIYGKRLIAIGSYSLMNAVNTNYNISIGADAQMNRTNGDGNVSLGFTTLSKNNGNYNTALGHSAMFASKAAAYDVSIGWNAGYMDEGSCNINIGGATAYKKAKGNNNVFIGHSAGRGTGDSTGSYETSNSVFIGHEAGYAVTTGATDNTVVGFRAGKTLTTGKRNILIGSTVEVDAPTGSDQLNIGNLLKGSIASSNRYLSINGGLELSSIPTSDPGITGRVWNDNGIVKVSAGA